MLTKLIKNEKQIINIIKFTPPILIIIVSLVLTLFFYFEKQYFTEKEKSYIKTQYIKSNKTLIKNQIEQLYNFIIKTQNETENKLKLNIKNRVYEAHSIASKIYKENKDSKTNNEIKKMIQDALVDIRFNDGRGYYFIYSMDYQCVLLPIARQLEGTNFYDYKDGKGKYLTRDIVEQVKKEKEGFLTWFYHKPEDMNKQYKKIGFNMYFEPLDWFIGTGEYFEDYEKEVKEEILNYVKKLNNTEYTSYFILDYEKNILFHKNIKLINDPKAKISFFNNKMNILNDMVAAAKLGEGFISYPIKKQVENQKLSTETSYIKGLKNWQWVIGQSFNQDEINKLFKEKEKELNKSFNETLLVLFYISILITIPLLLFSIYIAKLLDKKFLQHKEEINEYIQEREKQHSIVAQQAKMASMGEMLGNIAHQWRQPLSVITTASTGLKIQKNFDQLDDETLNNSLDSITNTAKYLSKTIDDFRNFFKSTKRENSFTIDEAFDKALKLTQAQFKNKDIKTIINIKDFQIYGLENELLQALINILNNARDALENEKNNKFLFIDAYEENSIAYIKIKDNGGGIDEKIMNKICEPYFTTKHSSQGTGIGLYMTQEIITKHMKGKLIIENVNYKYQDIECKGAQFTIVLNLSTLN